MGKYREWTAAIASHNFFISRFMGSGYLVLLGSGDVLPCTYLRWRVGVAPPKLSM